MYLDLLVENIWLSVGIWICLYVSDSVLTIVGARTYYSGFDRYVSIPGSYELTPYYEKDVDSLKWCSPRFIVMLVFSSCLLVINWHFLLHAFSFRWAFEAILGWYLLLEISVHFRHVNNLISMASAVRSGGISGRIEFARAVIYRRSAVELSCFAVLYTVLFGLVGRSFLLGGAVGCCVAAWDQWKLSGKELPGKTGDVDPK